MYHVVMVIQDDSRERQMIDRFNLFVPKDHSRGDIDAFLELDGTEIPFELKSTTSDTFVSARDFGPNHIKKYRDKKMHWLFGFYSTSETQADYFVYCSPSDMEPWYEQIEAIISRDAALADILPNKVNQTIMRSIMGNRIVYTYKDAKDLLKNQLKKQEYLDHMDLDKGYSPSRMTELLRMRADYLLRRGLTLNNPHINKDIFVGKPHITNEPALTLRKMVKSYLENSRATEDAAA
ncbi:hypothetical protein COO72_05090 [Bifidobacterium callitrichos]|nr:hypothetical protein COO72_05090 [Bifidobacterium callitrichos]